MLTSSGLWWFRNTSSFLDWFTLHRRAIWTHWDWFTLHTFVHIEISISHNTSGTSHDLEKCIITNSTAKRIRFGVAAHASTLQFHVIQRTAFKVHGRNKRIWHGHKRSDARMRNHSTFAQKQLTLVWCYWKIATIRPKTPTSERSGAKRDSNATNEQCEEAELVNKIP